MRIQQLSELLDYVAKCHLDMEKLYKRLDRNADSSRVKMMLTYFQQHQRHIYETLESYIRRLERLEEISESFDGVEKSFAIQAGREVRIIVRPDVVDDVLAHKMASDIRKKIEEELDYPGHIKVTVIRETRAVEYAK